MNNHNLQKLPSYQKDFLETKVMIVGGGAVGSFLAYKCVKKWVGKLCIVDFDRVEGPNLDKCAPLFCPDDIGESKAITLSNRLQQYKYEDSEVIGVDSDVQALGPLAFAQFDVILIAVDNFDAKIYINQQLMQLPKQKRPKVVMGGTYKELAQSNAIDWDGPCLRCLMDESWLKHGDIHTTCTGAYYKRINNQKVIVNGIEQVIDTSADASDVAASLMVEHFRGIVLNLQGVGNTHLSYVPFPRIGLERYFLSKKYPCPDCKGIEVRSDVRLLRGDVMHLSIEDTLNQIKSSVETDNFEVLVHEHAFGKDQYTRVIGTDYCRCCGKRIKLFLHERYVKEEDVLCDECRGKDLLPKLSNGDQLTDVIYGITVDMVDDNWRDRTLYELGWPIGAIITVRERKEHTILDELLSDVGTNEKIWYFACDNDPLLIQQTTMISEPKISGKE